MRSLLDLASGQEGSISASSTGSLVSYVTNGYTNVSLIAFRRYDFTPDVPVLEVGERVPANVTVNCNGATLVENPLERFYKVYNNSSLTLSNCTIVNPSIVPFSDLKLSSTIIISEESQPSPLGAGSKLYITESILYWPDCTLVSSLMSLATIQPDALSLTKMNDTAVYINTYRPPLIDTSKLYVMEKTMLTCELYNATALLQPPLRPPPLLSPPLPLPPPSPLPTSSPSKLDPSVWAIIVTGFAVFALCKLVAFFLYCRYRRRKAAKKKAEIATALATVTIARADEVKEIKQVVSDSAMSDDNKRDSQRLLATGQCELSTATASRTSKADSESRSGSDSENPRGLISNAIKELTQELHVEQLQIHEIIAQGGFGTVYAGTWRSLSVAVKTVIFNGDAAGSASMQRAAAEVSIAYNLSHDNVVVTFSHELKQITDAHVQELNTWKLYLIQELCNAGTLGKFLESGELRSKHGGLNISRILKLLTGVACGMEHLHSKRIAHGDLNPNNILLQVANTTPDEKLQSKGRSTWKITPPQTAQALDLGLCTAKITDFGLSLRIDNGQTHVSNINQGTPFYIAPELIQHRRLVPESDVFSYGVIMWCVANSELPYIQRDGILERNPNFPAFQHYVPLNYALLAVACMSRDYTERPSFSQILDVLKDIQTEMDDKFYIDAEGCEQMTANIGFQPTDLTTEEARKNPVSAPAKQTVHSSNATELQRNANPGWKSAASFLPPLPHSDSDDGTSTASFRTSYSTAQSARPRFAPYDNISKHPHGREHSVFVSNPLHSELRIMPRSAPNTGQAMHSRERPKPASMTMSGTGGSRPGNMHTPKTSTDKPSSNHSQSGRPLSVSRSSLEVVVEEL